MRRAATLFAVILAVGASRLAAQLPAGAGAPRQDADAQIRELQAEADRLATQSRTLLGELRRLEIERAVRAAEVRKADAALAALNTEIARTTARAAALESTRVASQVDVRDRLVAIYKRGRGGYLRLLLASDDLGALGRLTRAVAAIARVEQGRIAAHRRTLAAEREALAELRTRQQALTAAQSDARRAHAALDLALAAHNRRIDEVDARRDLTAQYVGELQAADAALQRQVSATTSSAAAAPLERRRGALDWPVAGRILSRYGRGTTRSGAAVDRNGIEIAAAAGQEVRAVDAGVVTFAAPFVGFGTLVIVDHGGNDFTLYGHLEHAAVAAGTHVPQGSIVGRAGRNLEGIDAVYFEVRVDGRPVNPVEWMKPERR